MDSLPRDTRTLTPGMVRVRSDGTPESTLVEVYQGDGLWLPVEGVIRVAFSIRAGDTCSCTVHLHPSAFDAVMGPDQVFAENDEPDSEGRLLAGVAWAIGHALDEAAERPGLSRSLLLEAAARDAIAAFRDGDRT